MNITYKEAARRIGCSATTMRRLMKAGKAPGVKIGRGWIVSEDKLQEWIDDQCHYTSEKTALTGGARLAATLASQRAQRIGRRLKSSSAYSPNENGESRNLATVLPLHGQKSQSAG